MADEPEDKVADTTEPVDTAREEVAETEPKKAPLPDPAGLAHTLSPVDLPEPDQPLRRPLAWTFTVIAVASLVLALFNAHAIRGWAYGLKPTPVSERIVSAAEAWHDLTERLGLTRPSARLRAWWSSAKAARFPGQPQGDQIETGSDEETPEPAE